MTFTAEGLKTVNDWADFWRNDIGVNVIPANTRKKETYESWKEWQDNPVPDELHKEWKTSGAFDNGIAIVLGKVHHNKQKEGLYLIGIDCDNKKAIDEICSRNEQSISFSQLAQWTLVEQHEDDPTKAHVLLYSHKPFPKKSSDNNGHLNSKLNANEVPAIEVKGLGSHGILFVTPSVHKNGQPYQIIGTPDPVIADDFVNYIDNICRKYAISYLETADNGNGKALLPIQDLFKPDFTIYEGHNRHESLMRIMESLIARTSGILSLEEIKSLAYQWNLKHCSPPLDDKEFEKQWNCATDFTTKNKKQNHKKKNDDEDEDDATKYTAYKYSKGIPLAEEILLGYQNVFLQIIDGKPITKPAIELWDKNIVIEPHEASEISPVLPYAFTDIDEINYFVEQAKKETIDSLFFKSKSLWKKFVVTKDEYTIVLLAADQTYTYFQDKFPTTHYDVATGVPGSGKGAMLVTFKLLGYRTVLASDMSGANLLDILGHIELGQVTIAEDELDDIDRDEIKRKIYKIGYDNTGQTTRTLDGSLSTRTNRWYYTYSFKIFAAEQPPDSKGLEGFNDRTFRIESLKGNPRFLVKTVLNEMQKSSDKQNPKYKAIISKIDYLRKLLLVYRLLHYEDVIEEVDANIDGRALELTSPQIYLFYSDKLASPDKKACKEVLDTLSKVLQRKGELAKKTLEGVIYETLTKVLFPDATPEPVLDVNGDNRTKYTLTYEEICNETRDTLEGESTGEQSFYCTDYDVVTHNKILKICRDRFLAEPKTKGRDKDKKRTLIFDKEVVEKVGKTFDVITKIEIKEHAQEVEIEDKEDQVWSNWYEYAGPGAGTDILNAGTKEQIFSNTEHIDGSDGQNRTSSLGRESTSSYEDSTTLNSVPSDILQKSLQRNTKNVGPQESPQSLQTFQSTVEQNSALFVPTDQNLFPCSQLQNEIEDSTSETAQIEQLNIKSPYESLIQEECFQSTGQPYYRCKIHPDIWHTDLAQIEGHCKNEHRD